MIRLTYREILEATASGSYPRFRAIPKSITAGHKNRKVPAAIDAEVRHFVEQRDSLVARFGGTVNKDKTDYVWPEKDSEEETAAHKAAATKALDELMAQEIELPGEPIKMADLLGGGLLEEDFDRLEKFLT